ncbi:mucin-22 isoform X1 [Procambarus clarkii]|uniref:mucin-22 isoform X1 n=1 Tax=Procambarus clarkii TaxID=6728 RepID=UPI0037442696
MASVQKKTTRTTKKVTTETQGQVQTQSSVKQSSQVSSHKSLTITKKGQFFSDSFFEDTRQDFQDAIKDVLTKCGDKSSKGDDITSYRSLRSRELKDENQAIKSTDDELFHKIVVDVNDFINGGEVTVKTVEEREVVVEGRVERKQGNTRSSKSFKRSFILPEDIDVEALTAVVSSDGVLIIKAPKKPCSAPSSQISVKVQKQVQSSTSTQKTGQALDTTLAVKTENVKQQTTKTSQDNVVSQKVTQKVTTVTEGTVSDTASRPLPIAKKGLFFDDSFFEDSRQLYQTAVRQVLEKSNEKSSQTDDITTYRNLRRRDLKEENQAVTVNEGQQTHKIIVDVQDFINGGEVTVKTVDEREVVIEGHIEKQEGNRRSSKSFCKRFVLSEDIDVESLTCVVSADGVLTITAPRKPSAMPVTDVSRTTTTETRKQIQQSTVTTTEGQDVKEVVVAPQPAPRVTQDDTNQEKTVTTVTRQVKTVTDTTTTSDAGTRPLPITKKGPFFDDSFFEDSRQPFQKAVRQVLEKTNETSSQTDDLTTYRNLRQRDLKEENQAVTVNEDQKTHKIIVDVQDFINGGEVTVKTVEEREVVIEGHIEKQEGNRRSSKSFCKRFVLSEDIDVESLTCVVSADGVLTITAPRKPTTMQVDGNIETTVTKKTVKTTTITTTEGLEEDEPTPVKPEPTPVKPEPIPVKPEPIPVKPEPTPVKPEPTPVKSEPVVVEPESTETTVTKKTVKTTTITTMEGLEEDEPTPVKPEPIPVKPEPTPVKPEPTPVKSEPVVVEPESTETTVTKKTVKTTTITTTEGLEEDEPTPVKPEPIPVKPEPTPVKPEPTPVKPEPTPVKSEPVVVEPESTETTVTKKTVKTTTITTIEGLEDDEPTPVKPEPTPVKPEPTPVKSEPVVVEPESTETTVTKKTVKTTTITTTEGLEEDEPTPVKPEPIPVKPEPTPVKPEPTPVKPEPVVVEPESTETTVTKKTVKTTTITTTEGLEEDEPTPVKPKEVVKTSDENVVTRKVDTEKTVSTVNQQDTTVTDSTRRGTVTRVITIIKKGSFFDDSFFEDSRQLFQTAVRRVLEQFNETSSQTDDITTYRKLRQRDLREENQAVTVNEDQTSQKMIVDVQDFVNGGEVTVKTVNDREVVIEGHIEKQEGNRKSSKRFCKRFVLSEDIDVESLTCVVSADGVLTITAPRKPTTKQIDGSTETTHTKKTVKTTTITTIEGREDDEPTPVKPKEVVKTSDENVVTRKVDTEKTVSTVNQQDTTVTDSTTRGTVTRVITIIKKGSFFDDSFFEDSRQLFQTAVRRVLEQFNETSSQTDDITTYRKLRQRDLREENQAVTVNEDQTSQKMIVDVQDFVNGGEVTVKTVNGREVVVEGHIEKQEGNRKSSKRFCKRFILSEDIEVESVTSVVSTDGVLTITAPRKTPSTKQIEDSTETTQTKKTLQTSTITTSGQDVSEPAPAKDKTVSTVTQQVKRVTDSTASDTVIRILTIIRKGNFFSDSFFEDSRKLFQSAVRRVLETFHETTTQTDEITTYRNLRRRDLREENQANTVNEDQQNHKIIVDVQDFVNGGEVTVKIVNEKEVVVEGRIEKQEVKTTTTKRFCKRFVLPEDTDAKSASAVMSADGVLTIITRKKVTITTTKQKEVSVEKKVTSKTVDRSTFNKVLTIVVKGAFFSDTTFEDVRQEFQSSIKTVVEKFKIETTSTDQFTAYRNFRKRNPKNENQAFCVKDTEDVWKAVIDVCDFVGGVKVQVINGQEIKVEGRGNRQEGVSVVSFSFMRGFILPDDCDLEAVSAVMSAEGVLTIVGPKIK